MDDGRVAVSNGNEPKSEFQESALKTKLNRNVTKHDLESTESGWNRDGIAIRNPLGSIGVAYGIDSTKSVIWTNQSDFEAGGV
ncbi:hypothetical protein LXL04_035072 [Taraxacum kok-saghyz]